MTKIRSALLLDNVDELCAKILSDAGIAVTLKGKLSLEDLLQEIKHYDALVVRSATKVTAEVLKAGQRLQLVGRAGVGVDNIDVDAATRRGVLVMNTPSGNTLSAAEHTCTLMVSLGRFVPQACASLKAGQWDRKAFMGTELYGKTLGVIGMGRIGREVATRMQSFGMTVIGYDPFVSKEAAAQWNIEALDLEEIWPRADFITLHTPLLPHTKNMINDDVLKNKCKKGVKIVNVARGGIIDEAALLRALESGHCGGAGLDVFLEEPPKDLSLIKHPKVICTPHLGASTLEAQVRVAQELAEQIVSLSKDGRAVGLVNGEALVAAGDETARRWLTLSSALGCIADVVVSTEETMTVSIHCQGVECAQQAVETAVLQGLIKTRIPEANLVNSRVLAAEQKIHLQNKPSTNGSDADLSTRLLSVTVSSGKQSVVLSGTVMNGEPRLVAVNGNVFEGGVSLSTGLLLFTADATAPRGSVMAAVAASAAAVNDELLSLTACAKGNSQLWVAVCVARKPQSPITDPTIGKFVGSVSFDFKC